MGLRIATNVASMVASHRVATNAAAQQSTLERLSSGNRINKAADDAAGLAIADKMKAQIRSIRQDIRNANDGISMVQTAEGGMNELGNILTRFRELAIQASSDTVGNDDRLFIDKEVQQMKQEVGRITSATEFNGRKLLNGQGGVMDIQVGTNNHPEEDRIVMDLTHSNVSLEALGLTNFNVSDKETARSNLDVVDSASRTLAQSRADIGALQNRLQSTISNMNSYDENISASRSRIADADIAQEAAELAKNNILTTASVSVLSQANQEAMLALKLLG